jgi:WD40 repeat protein
VVTLCEDGTVSWILLTSEHKICSIKKLNFGGKFPLLASFHPLVPWMLAVGCKGGMLYFIDTRGKNYFGFIVGTLHWLCQLLILGIQRVIHKIRAHEKDIHSLVWCPISKPGNWGTIASSSQDRLIKIWDAKEGNCLAQGKIPFNTGKHCPESISHQSDKRHIWIALDWINGDHILSSGLGGELLLWDVRNFPTVDLN